MELNKFSYAIMGAVFLFLGFTFLLVPIFDPDFFFHIKTGQWIWQQGGLPQYDPFSFTSPSVMDSTQQFKLTSYWLAQVFYYGLHDALGWFGIIGARYLYVLIIVAALMARKKQSNSIFAIFVTAFMVALLSEHSLDRPQTFTYCFFALAMLLFERYGQNEKKGIFFILIPSVAFLWSNMHGGFVLLHVLSVWFILGEVYSVFLQKKPIEGLRVSVALFLLVIVASFVNPNYANTLAVYDEMLFGSSKFIFAFISEYQSVAELISQGKYIFFFYPILFALSCWFFINDGLKKNVVNISFFLAFGFYSYSHMRYLPLFAIFCLPFSANALSHLGAKRASVLSLAMLALVLLAAPVLYNSDNLSKLKNAGPIDTMYPAGAVAFLKQNKIKGNILNEYDWGGYLIWELGVESKVFIDTRAMDVSVFKDWVFMSADRNAGNLIRKYDFDLAVLPPIIEGQPNPMIRRLYSDKSWTHVYGSANATVFIKD